jgi:hypothetical protein
MRNAQVGILLLLVSQLFACGDPLVGWPTDDLTAPTVSSTNPGPAGTGAPINGTITATFSEELDPGTVVGTTFYVQQAGTTVAGAVTYAGVTAVFTPTSSLAVNTLYTATVTTGVMDLAGNALVANHAWSFTTGAAPTPPSPRSAPPRRPMARWTWPSTPRCPPSSARPWTP